VYFPKVTTIGTWAFSGCFNLEIAEFPEVRTINTQAFSETNLSLLYAPRLTTMENEIFRVYPEPANVGRGPLTLVLGSTGPVLGRDIFMDINTPKTVTVIVPEGALRYGDVPSTTEDADTTLNWSNGLRGGGVWQWNISTQVWQWNAGFFGLPGPERVNQFVTVNITTETK
jgi:hypothetical protein